MTGIRYNPASSSSDPPQKTHRTNQAGREIGQTIPVAGAVADNETQFMRALFQESRLPDIRRRDPDTETPAVEKGFAQILDASDIQQIRSVIRHAGRGEIIRTSRIRAVSVLQPGKQRIRTLFPEKSLQERKSLARVTECSLKGS